MDYITAANEWENEDCTSNENNERDILLSTIDSIKKSSDYKKLGYSIGKEIADNFSSEDLLYFIESIKDGHKFGKSIIENDKIETSKLESLFEDI